MLATVADVSMSSCAPVKGQDGAATPQASAPQRRPPPGDDGLIPVDAADTVEVYYIVDCPALHMIEATILFADGYYRGSNFDLITLDTVQVCPRCAGTIRKARRIPIPPPESERQPAQGHYRSRSTGSLAPPPPQAHRSRTPSIDQQISTPTPDDTMNQAASSGPPHAILPPDDGLMLPEPLPVQAQVGGPTVPGSPGRTQSFVSTDTSHRGHHRSLIRLFRTPRFREPRVGPLPDSLTFTFSAAGNSILLWRRNGHSLVRIQVQERSSCSLPLLNALPASEGDRTVTIKLIHEGREWIAIILYYHQRFSLLVTHCSGSHHSILPLPPNKKPLVLRRSRDDAFIAIGYGSSVHLYRYNGHFKIWGVDIPILEFPLASAVRFQTLSFSPDGRFLAVATQKYDQRRGRDDDGVWVRLWGCEEQPGQGILIGSSLMPTNHLGVTDVFFDPTANKAFLAGFIDTPYQLFHGGSAARPGSPAPHEAAAAGKAVGSFKIRCAAQSPNPTDVCFLTAANKLMRASLQTEAVTPWADLSALRGRLDLRDEPAALASPVEGLAYVVWKDVGGFYLVEVRQGVSELDKINLRYLIDLSGWLETE